MFNNLVFRQFLDATSSTYTYPAGRRGYARGGIDRLRRKALLPEPRRGDYPCEKMPDLSRPSLTPDDLKTTAIWRPYACS